MELFGEIVLTTRPPFTTTTCAVDNIIHDTGIRTCAGRPLRKNYAEPRNICDSTEDLQIGDLGRVGDFKTNNDALMPDTCLGENQETNINIYISSDAGRVINGREKGSFCLTLEDATAYSSPYITRFEIINAPRCYNLK